MKFKLHLFVIIFIAISNSIEAQSFQKDFDLFSIRIDRNETFFIPKDVRLKKQLGKEEINFKHKIYFYEGSDWYGYGINIDQKIVLNDSMMNEMRYAENMDNTTVIEKIGDRLIVSVPNASREKELFLLDENGEKFTDDSGKFYTEKVWEYHSDFFLYDLKGKKVLIEDTLFWMDDLTEGGFLLESNGNSNCEECKFAMIDFDGKYLLNWMSNKEILSNSSNLKLIHPLAKSFYGLSFSEKYEYGEYYYIDKDNRSNYFKFNELHWYPSTEFYFSDYYTSYMQNDTIFVAMGEAKLSKYVAFVSPREFILFTDSIGPDKSKDYIPFDTSKIFLMDFSDFYIFNQPSKIDVGNIPFKIGTGTYNTTFKDSLDKNGKTVLGIISEDKGRLVVFNKKSKTLINEFTDRFLIDFNHNYYLTGIVNSTIKNKKVSMKYEYIIYDKEFNEFKRSKDKKEFYKLK